MNYYNASFIKSHTHSVVDGINVVRFNCTERRLHLSEQRRIKKSAAQFHFHAATEVAFSHRIRYRAACCVVFAAVCRNMPRDRTASGILPVMHVVVFAYMTSETSLNKSYFLHLTFARH